MGFSCMECLRRFSQFVLIIINIIVVVSTVPYHSERAPSERNTQASVWCLLNLSQGAETSALCPSCVNLIVN